MDKTVNGVMSDAQIVEAKNLFKNFRGHGFRDGQMDAIKFIYESSKPVVVLCAPTGSGKSLIGMVSGGLNEKFIYLCSSKQLQSQLHNDFPEVRIMQGRNSFGCRRYPRLCADQCTHSKSNPCRYKGKTCFVSDCYYDMQKATVLKHPYRVLNYHYMLFESYYVGMFADPDMFIICDEGDAFDSILTGFISLHISWDKIQTLQIDPPDYITSTAVSGLSSWKAWSDVLDRKIEEYIPVLEDDVLDTKNPDPAAVRKLNSYVTTRSMLKLFRNTMDASWIFEQKDNYKGDGYSFSFRPVWISSELARNVFWRTGKKFVLMSATFPPPKILARSLGLGPGDIAYAEIDSSFPASNRPVYLRPSGNLSNKTFDDDIAGMLDTIKDIISKHPGERGLIHTVSWKLNKIIMESLGNDDLIGDRLITHRSPFKDKLKALDTFSESKSSVFISPSSVRGLDLPGDLCRFIILPKCPFLFLGDKLTRTRLYSGPAGQTWYRSQCAQDIVQACGRGMRRMDDYCESYILDSAAVDLICNHRGLFPKYFIDACEMV